MKFVPAAYFWARQMATLLFPSCCLACSRDVLIKQGPVCPACLSTISVRPKKTTIAPGVIAISLAPFENTLKNLIHLYKYSGKDYLASILSQRMTHEWPTCPFDVDAIVPVPMPYLREIKRGYNQAGLLANELGHAWNKPVLGGILKRKWSRSQTFLSRSERLSNAAKSFEATYNSDLHRKHVLLVDDVITTGATLTACADALRACGASSISALTLAYD
jgi:ComF family protein